MLKIFRFFRPYRFELLVVLLFIFLQSLSELLLPTLMSDIVNIGITKGDIPYILRSGGLMLLAALGGMVCSIIASYLSSKASMGFGKIVREKLFRHVEKFSLHEIDKVSTPSLITRNTNDVNQVQMVTIMMLRIMIAAPIMCVGGIIMAISKDKALSWVIVIVIPILSAAVIIIMRNAIPLFKAVQKKLDKINQVLREAFNGIRVIRAFDRIEHEKKRFNEASLDLADTSTRVFKIMASLMPLMMLLMNITTIAIIWFGSIRVDMGEMKVGDMMAFLQYSMQILFSILMASMMFVMIPRAQASAERINEVLDIVPEINDVSEIKSPGSHRGHIEFRNVTFSYHGAEEPAVRDISFRTGPGEVTAIIGSTGSGKSTLVNLIPRFYDVDSGSVLVDGIDVREMSQESLRGKIGLVPQKAVLFKGTIFDNISFGKEGASEAEIQHAAGVAQAEEFIRQMKDGYQSQIAQDATNISGGQKQRLSIARALVRKPEIYIFDDSFSALDFKTDSLLRAALKKETADSSVIIIGQRVATIRDADRIIVLDDGRIAGIGRHQELLKSCEVYQEIVYSQLSREEIA